MESLPITESSSEFGVYTGVWINWSHSQTLGRTLTLNRRDGDLLIAFVALFVTIVGTSFWRVTCFAIHYYYSSEAPQDGVHHQRQAILRNAANGASGLWHLIQSVWAWRKNGTRPVTRVFPVILCAAFCVCAFGAASGFSSKVSTSMGNEVLISSSAFGIPDRTNLSAVDILTTQYPLTARQVISYTTYAQQCYTNESDIASCGAFVKPHLASQIIRNSSCPFAPKICHSDSKNIYLDTGLLDIHDDFGMNVPSNQRFQLRTTTHCAPLKTEGYKEHIPATKDTAPDGSQYMESAYTKYNYGRSLISGNATNATYEYPDRSPIASGSKGIQSYTIE